MKKLLFLLIAVVVTATVFAQVTTEIISVEPTTQGKYRGDLITFTVSAENNYVFGVSVITHYDGHNGHAGLWNPNAAGYTTGTYQVWIGYTGKFPKERTYTVQVWSDDLEQPLTYSEPVTVTK
jgi:hypothetical protein